MRPQTTTERLTEDYWHKVRQAQLAQDTKPGTTTRYPRLEIVWE